MKKTIYLITLFVLLISCNNHKEIKTNNNSTDTTIIKSVDSLIINQEIKEKDIFKNDNLIISGDSTKLDLKNISSIMIKFEPYISFKDYKVDTIFKGKIAEIDFKSHPIAREYKTIITRCYKKEKINFAGHYCLVSWRCGAPCNEFAIIDVIDGKVYYGFIAPNGFEYHKDSRMLIANPPNSDGFYEATCLYCKPEIWVFNEIKKIFVEKKVY